MKFEADRKALLEAAQLVGSIVLLKSMRPILQGVLITTAENHVVLRTTNMEQSARIKMEKVEVSEEGAALVPAKKLIEVLSKVEGEKVTIETTDKSLAVVTPRGKFRMFGDNPDDFPEMPGRDWSSALDLNGAVVKNMVDKTVFAAATERTRYALNGIFVAQGGGKLTLVATDGKRLALITRKTEGVKESEGVIVPVKFISLVAGAVKNDSFKLLIEGNEICAKVDNKIFASRLIEGHFPDYEAVMPKGNDKTLKIKTEEFKQLITEGALLGDMESRAVKLQFEGSKLVISSRAPDVGEAKVEAEVDYEGGALEIAFNPDYVLDGLKAWGDDVVLKLKDSSCAAVIVAENHSYVIMPVSTG